MPTATYDPTWPIAGPSSPPISAGGRANFQALQYAPWPNWLADPVFLIWPTSSTLGHWTLAGASAALSREATIIKVGGYSAKVIAGGAAVATLGQKILPGLVAEGLTYLRATEFTFGSWIYTGAASGVRLYIDDGVTPVYSSYHAGNSAWAWLSKTSTLDAAATKVEMGVQFAAAVTGYVAGPTGWQGAIAPADYRPCPVAYGFLNFGMSGSIAVQADFARANLHRPGIVKDVMVSLTTAPTGAAAIFDVLTWDGSAFASMFGGTKPQIAISDKYGSRQPDGTYERRCLGGLFGSGTTPAAGSIVSADCSQKGSTIAGANLSLTARVLTFLRPQEWALAYNEVAG